MSTHIPGFKSFLMGFFLHYFVLAKLVTSSIRVDHSCRQGLEKVLEVGGPKMVIVKFVGILFFPFLTTLLELRIILQIF